MLAFESWSFGARWCCTVGWWQWPLNEQNRAAIKKGSLLHTNNELLPCADQAVPLWGLTWAAGCVALAACAELGFQALSSPRARAASPWLLAAQWLLQCCLPLGRLHPRKMFWKSSLQDGTGRLWSASYLSYAELLLLLYYPTHISRSMLFPFLENTFILTKCFGMTKCWCRGMNTIGRVIT